MKTKEIVQLVVALAILMVAGYMIYTVLFPQQSAQAQGAATVSYVQVTPISPNFDSSSLSALNDSSRIHDFYTPPDLSSGLGNNQPFGPLH